MDTRQFGPYMIEASIGAGGMGEVFRAKDTRLGPAVAIKVIPRIWLPARNCASVSKSKRARLPA